MQDYGWDPTFADRSPMLEPVREHAKAFRAFPAWPARDDLQRLVPALKLVAPEPHAGPYEAQIHDHAQMPVRERDWHDFFNVLAWAAYPQTKRALNAAHYRAGFAGARGRARDALTVFDENGAIAVSTDPSLLEDLREFRWKRLFVERRAEVRDRMRFHVFGHALFEKALAPYVGMTAHALLVAVTSLEEDVDVLAAQAVDTLETPRSLAPLPLLGVPGWWAENELPAFYDDESYFRRGRGGKPRKA